MDADLNLNTSGPLPDRTGAAQSGGTAGAVGGVSAADIKRGYSQPNAEKTPRYDSENDGGENQVGDPNAYTGGVCGRPHGWAR